MSYLQPTVSTKRHKVQTLNPDKNLFGKFRILEHKVTLENEGIKYKLHQ